MEVNIVFQNEVLFNQKRDYYITNAIAFIENKTNYSKALKDLESIAENHLSEEKRKTYKIPLQDEGGISVLYDVNYFKNYGYYLDRSLMRLYTKTYKYINTKTNEIESFRVYNFLEHLRSQSTFCSLLL